MPRHLATMLWASPWFIHRQKEWPKYQSHLRRLLKPKHIKLKLCDSSLAPLYAPETEFGQVLISDAYLPSLARQGLLEELGSAIPHWQERFLTLSLRKTALDNKLFALPWYITTRLLFYRKDLLNRYHLKPPGTWAELEEQARFVLKRQADPKLTGLLFETLPQAGFAQLVEQLWSQGESFFTAEPSLAFNRRGVRQALERLLGWIHKSHLGPQHAYPLRARLVMNAFVSGHALFLFHWSDTLRFIAQAPAEARANLGWTLAPSARADRPGWSRLGGISAALPAHSRHREQALWLMNRLLEMDQAVPLEQRYGWPFASLLELQLDPDVRQVHPYYADTQFLLSRSRPAEQDPWLSLHFQDWQNFCNELLGEWAKPGQAPLDLPNHVDEIVERMKARFSRNLNQQQLSSYIISKAASELSKGAPLKIRDLAGRLGWTTEHFIRRFRAELGITPQAYLTEARLNLARDLLQRSSLSVHKVATRLGYKTPQHFCRAFKAYTGLSPGRFRRSQPAPEIFVN